MVCACICRFRIVSVLLRALVNFASENFSVAVFSLHSNNMLMQTSRTGLSYLFRDSYKSSYRELPLRFLVVSFR